MARAKTAGDELRRNGHETSEVSVHLARIFLAIRCGKWMTAKEVATIAVVDGATARGHLRRLVKQGLLDQAEVFPGHRYRMSSVAEKRNLAFVRRLEQAVEIFTECGLIAAPVPEARRPEHE